MKVSSSPQTMENSQTNNPTEGKKGKAARIFLRRVFFFCCDPDRVVRLSAQTDALSLDDPEMKPVPGPSRIKPIADADPAVPELLCLPGQVCEYPPSSSGIKRTPDPETPAPDSSSLNLCDKNAKKGMKRKTVRAFFRRAHEAMKQIFCTVQPPKADESRPVPEEERLPEQVSADLESAPVEEEEDAVLPGSVSGSVSIVLKTASDTVSPEPEIDLPQGSVVSLFEVGHLIKSGNFSKVYEGTHVFSEKVKVVIKCVPKRRADRYLDIAGHSKPVLAEVALMLRLGEAPSCPNIIHLHQWLEDQSSFSLIMEYPEPCRTLEDFILFSGPISEGQARLFMLQAVRAVKHCYERGVYHGDIRSGNILVTLHSLELKLIDFRCARLITSEGFNSGEYQGSNAYTPPEVIRESVFHAEAANVWAMGVLLFEIMHGYLPFESFDQIQHGYVKMDPTLSTACHDLIYRCLSRNPALRLKLEQLEEQRWMKA